MEIGKAINAILSGGSTSMKPHPDFGRNEHGNTYITYRETGVTPSDTKSGASTLDEVEVEIVVFSDSISTASDLAKKVRLDLDRKPYGVYGGVSLGGVQFRDEDTDYNPTTNRYEIEQSYIFRVRRSLSKQR